MYIVTFSCGDTELCDTLEEADEIVVEHGFDCLWAIYTATLVKEG